MNKFLSLLVAAVVLTTSCRKIEEDVTVIGGNNGGTDSTAENTILEGKISSDRTLKANYTYKLRGIVYVVNGAKLTIEPGTVIQGEKGTNSRGTLVITKGCQIIADATKDNPIVFTSDQANPARGDWGGIVILGNAKTNASYNGVAGVGSVEGGVNNAEGLGLYGGTNDADNSGTLRYVRIEYAGYAYLPDNELNGLTLAGVGNATTIDYVEIFKANDDAIECFGGSVNLKHTIFISTLDDDFDTDNGWSGKVQWGIVMRDSSVADISKSESFESDNDANGSSLLPQTSGVYSNITVIGPRATTANIGNSLFLAGAQIRRNSTISIFNSVIMGYPTGLLIDASKGTPTDNNIAAGTLFVQHTTIAGCATPVSYSESTSSPTGWKSESAALWFATTEYGNSILAANDDVKLAAPYNYSSPDFTPQDGSPLLTGADFTNSKLASGFTPTSYRGAVGPVGSADADWWKGWSKLNLSL
ncbi:hypothetical protein [Panacibacter ginsenosidivorans]|uniref:hypothetical protein n=1 Tax=Panacibacter ginsenosidivorans TaxID=1813871 RepID=UPI0018647756|nr:hypothetical protein [Panacibacter ginsenosidivorans]